MLWVTRLAILVVGLVGGYFAVIRGEWINQAGNMGSAVMAASFFPLLVGALYFRSITAPAVLAATIVGAGTVLALYWVCLAAGLPFGVFTLLPGGIHPAIWGIIISFVIMFIVSTLGKPTSAQLEVFKIVSTVPESDRPTPEKTRSLRRVVYGVLTYAVAQTVVLLYLSGF